MTYDTKGLWAEQHVSNTLLCCSKFTHSRRVSERREGKRERQVMLPLVPLIKFVLQYCAKVMQTNFDKIPGFSWLFEEISLQTIFQRNVPAFS